MDGDGQNGRETGPAIIVRAPTVWDFGYLAHSMRADEIEQFMCLTEMDAYDPNKAAVAFMNAPGPTFCYVGRDGLPILAGGFRPIGIGVHQCWMAGTQKGWDENGRAITKMTYRIMSHMLARPDFRRLQIPVLACRTKAQDWYVRGLRMHREGPMTSFGKNGEDFVMYARIKAQET